MTIVDKINVLFNLFIPNTVKPV